MWFSVWSSWGGSVVPQTESRSRALAVELPLSGINRISGLSRNNGLRTFHNQALSAGGDGQLAVLPVAGFAQGFCGASKVEGSPERGLSP